MLLSYAQTVSALPVAPWVLLNIPEDAVVNTEEGEIGFYKFEAEGPWDWIENMSANAINYLFLAGMILAPLLILFGAFLFLTSGGDAARVGKGKALITWSSIGLAIILSARVIMAIVRYLFDF